MAASCPILDSMSTVPPGWYQDPAGGTARRWWDGGRWTDHLEQPLPPVPAEPAVAAQAAPAYAPQAGYSSEAATSAISFSAPSREPQFASTANRLAYQYSRDPALQQAHSYAGWGSTRPLPVWTPAIWVIVLMPIWADVLVCIGAILGGVLLGTSAPTTTTQTLGELLLADVGVVWLITVIVGFLCAFLDRGALLRAGYQRAASVAWMLLTPLGYVIARRVVMKRETGRGDAPSNVLGGLLLAGIALNIVLRVVGNLSMLG